MEHPKPNFYEIEIAKDHEEASQFSDWLNAQGHNAWVGPTTGSFILWISSKDDQKEILENLWDTYCNS